MQALSQLSYGPTGWKARNCRGGFGVRQQGFRERIERAFASVCCEVWRHPRACVLEVLRGLRRRRSRRREVSRPRHPRPQTSSAHTGWLTVPSFGSFRQSEPSRRSLIPRRGQPTACARSNGMVWNCNGWRVAYEVRLRRSVVEGEPRCGRVGTVWSGWRREPNRRGPKAGRPRWRHTDIT